MRKDLLELPPLDHLKGFVAAVERQSITLAAADLCLTQSAVSRQIRGLEEALGVELLRRRPRAFEPTAQGMRLYRVARDTLAAIGEVAREIGRGRAAAGVAVTASLGVSSLWLLPRLGRFQARQPEVEVRVIAANRVLDLRQEGIDLSIRYAPDAVPGAAKLFDEFILPVASPDLARSAFRSARSLAAAPRLELDEGARPGLRWADWPGAVVQAAAPARSHSFNHYDQVVQAALKGQGVALGRLPLVVDLLAEGRLCAWRGAPVFASPYAYWLVQGPGPQRAALEGFVAWLREEAAATAEALSRRFG